MQNLYIDTLRTAWYEKQQRGFVYFLFILANVVAALRPLLFGWFIGALQRSDAAALRSV